MDDDEIVIEPNQRKKSALGPHGIGSWGGLRTLSMGVVKDDYWDRLIIYAREPVR